MKAESAENKAKWQANVDALEKRNDQLEDDIDDFKDGASETWTDFKNRIEKSKNDINADIEAYKKEHNY